MAKLKTASLENTHPDASYVCSMRPKRLTEAVAEGLRRVESCRAPLTRPPSYGFLRNGKRTDPESASNCLNCTLYNNRLEMAFFHRWESRRTFGVGNHRKVSLPAELIAQLMALLAGRGNSLTWQCGNVTPFSASSDPMTGEVEMTIATKEVIGFKIDTGTIKLTVTDRNNFFEFLSQHLLAWMPTEEPQVEAPSFGLANFG